MCNYYAKFVPRFAHIASPLYQLLRKDTTWTWNFTHQSAMDSLKHALCHAPVLTMPDFDTPFQIETDASDVAIGAVLT